MAGTNGYRHITVSGGHSVKRITAGAFRLVHRFDGAGWCWQNDAGVFTPAAAIRGLAVLRTLARYLERVVTHDATLRLLAVLRVWFYKHLEPLAPARLQEFRDGDLLTRLRADIDSLDNFYLRILAPAIAALISSVAILCLLFWFSPAVAGIDAVMLLVAGW